MESKEIKEYLKEAKSKLNFIIKNEVKRKFVGETYSYLIKIPQIAFWLVAIVSIFAVLTIELIIAGIVLANDPVQYNHLLLGFGIAAILGMVNGNFYRRKLSKKIHDQIAETLKHKEYKEETIKDN
jgi:hypothetical protein